jgi:hypothetical protein
MNTADLKQRIQGRLGGVAVAFHHGFALFGVAAVLFLLVQGTALVPSKEVSLSPAFGPIRFDQDGLLAERTDSVDNERYRVIANYLSRRYRIAPDATEQLVGAAYDVGQQVGLDPLLILAVVAIESRFNPIAESGMGAKGLMQVIPKYHQDKLIEHGGEEAVLDPMTNILLGARILKEYIRRMGSLEAGLQFYNGALSDPTSQYAQKVIAEQERLRQAVRRFDRPAARSAA